MGRALEPGAKLGKRCGALGVVRRAFRELCLQVDGRERRAELVRGVGDERALSTERAIQPRQESVQRVNEGRDFDRKSGFGQRQQRARRPLADGDGNALERTQTARDAEPDQQREERDDCEQRQDRAQRHARGELTPSAHRLRDLHQLPIGDRAEHTPRARGRPHGIEAGCAS